MTQKEDKTVVILSPTLKIGLGWIRAKLIDENTIATYKASEIITKDGTYYRITMDTTLHHIRGIRLNKAYIINFLPHEIKIEELMAMFKSEPDIEYVTFKKDD